jgi:signal peptidase I
MRLKRWQRRALWGLAPLAILALVYGALRLWVYDVVTLQHRTEDMWPVAATGATVVVNRRATIQRGDLVVMKREQSGLMLRRVVGLPHEKIWFIDSRPYLLGRSTTWREVGRYRQGDRWMIVDEESLGGAAYLVIDDVHRRMNTAYAVDCGEGYYVLADNREHLDGKDSRAFGPVPASDIRGVVAWIVDPGDVPVYYPVPPESDAGPADDAAITSE